VLCSASQLGHFSLAWWLFDKDSKWRRSDLEKKLITEAQPL